MLPAGRLLHRRRNPAQVKISRHKSAGRFFVSGRRKSALEKILKLAPMPTINARPGIRFVKPQDAFSSAFYFYALRQSGAITTPCEGPSCVVYFLPFLRRDEHALALNFSSAARLFQPVHDGHPQPFRRHRLAEENGCRFSIEAAQRIVKMRRHCR